MRAVPPAPPVCGPTGSSSLTPLVTVVLREMTLVALVPLPLVALVPSARAPLLRRGALLPVASPAEPPAPFAAVGPLEAVVAVELGHRVESLGLVTISLVQSHE